MSRDDGFAVMDVSVDIVNDPKIRKLYRHAPDQAGAAFIAYVATMGESWKAGHRVTIEDAWPAFVPFDPAAVAALEHVKLVDAKGFVSMKAWQSWFAIAKSRRDQSRERWRRANEKRPNPSTDDRAVTTDVSAQSPRGSDAVTASPVPLLSVPSRSVDSREIPPPPAERGRRKTKTNLRANGKAPRDTGSNPRSKGTSTRQVRADQKRGPTAIAEVLRQAAIVDVKSDEVDEADAKALEALL